MPSAMTNGFLGVGNRPKLRLLPFITGSVCQHLIKQYQHHVNVQVIAIVANAMSLNSSTLVRSVLT